MSNTIAYVDNQTLTNIADAVRYKTGTNGKMLLSDIPDKIRNIEGIVPTGTQTITENGEYDVLSDKSVTVDVQPDLRPLSVNENGSYQPDGFDGYSQVDVGVLSIMDSLLEIVSVVTPAEDVYSMEFPCNNIVTGKYIIVSNPPGTRDFASQQNYGETINVGSFSIRGKTGGSLSIVTDSTIFYLKTPSNTSDNDWWQSSASFGDNGIIFSLAQGRYPFLAGVTYYLLRVKGA